MDDFDDQLLALAGDESDSEQENGSGAGPSRSPSLAAARSPSPQHSLPDTSTEAKSSKTAARRGTTMTKRRKADESEEEGEASSAPSSPGSLGSGAMDESDSDTSPGDIGDTGDHDNLYPLEGKYRDAADRAEIMNMSQLDRERILADRNEEQSERRRLKNLGHLVGVTDRANEKLKNKRKASTADLDDDDRKSARPRTKRSDALESYTRQREHVREEKSRRANRVTGGRRSRSRSRGNSSERDADGESDDDFSGNNVRAPEPEIPAELHDIQRIKVGRSNFAKVCFYPGFEETMIGCFSRVAVNQGKYRLARITGIKIGKPYLLEIPGSVFYTDQYVILATGKLEKDWPFTHCSDSKVTEEEFKKWKDPSGSGETPQSISRSTCNAKCDSINRLINHRFSNEEISKKFEKQHKYRDLLTQSQPKASLQRTTSVNEQQNSLRLLNEKNRRENSENIRKALVAEKNRQRANARAKELAASQQKKEQILAVPRGDDAGLFSEGSDISRTGTPVQTAPPQKKKVGIPKFTKMSVDDDVIGSMDLGIDLDL
ncbi:rna polymerase ii transcription elongation factor [Venturia nashicola]|nr:rna polymerase ii transcription elongation factor [Venturia nashicola]